jgi:hypothetical protein
MHNDSAISCEACHTQWYPSCWNCHNGKTDKTVDSLFLAVSPLTKKFQPAAHSPATNTTGTLPSSPAKGGWAIKTRHSWGASQTCETCHTSLDVFISAVERQAPFVGYWSSKRANAVFVDEKLAQILVIDSNKLKQDAHKDVTCEDCHKSLADNVCADCHVKSVKTGKTFLKADADWSRTDYIAARTALENAADIIRQAKASGMNVDAWERDWQNLKDSYLQTSNDFHGQPGQAQVAMRTTRPNSQAFLRSIQETVLAQQNQNRGLQVGLLFGTGTVGAVLVGFVLNRKHKR